jgi:hypothetical protein
LWVAGVVIGFLLQGVRLQVYGKAASQQRPVEGMNPQA